MEVGVDPFEFEDAAHFVDRGEHRALQRDRGGPAVGLRGGLPAPGEQRRTPTTVAARGTEPGDLGLDHHDVETRVLHEQLVRGPQPGEPGTDDHDVGLLRSRERVAGCERVGDGVEPQTAAPEPRFGRMGRDPMIHGQPTKSVRSSASTSG